MIERHIKLPHRLRRRVVVPSCLLIVLLTCLEYYWNDSFLLEDHGSLEESHTTKQSSTMPKDNNNTATSLHTLPPVPEPPPPSPPFGVLGILSADHHLELRNTLRQTVVKDLPRYNVTARFLLDQHTPELDNEQAQYGDLIFLDHLYVGQIRYGIKCYIFNRVHTPCRYEYG